MAHLRTGIAALHAELEREQEKLRTMREYHLSLLDKASVERVKIRDQADHCYQLRHAIYTLEKKESGNVGAAN